MTHSKKQLNAGILSYGMSGKLFHAPFLSQHEGFKLRAVTERTKKSAQQNYPDIISYDSVGELLEDGNIDLVVVNTPNYLHYEQTKAALEHGKHVLVEKPFVPDRKQAEELFELSERLGKKIFVYQNRRWDSDFVAVKSVIESGRLGKLCEFHIRYDRYRNVIGPKEFKETPMAASGLLFDLGPHMLDQTISLFGKPLSYHKFLGKNRESTQVDDYFSIQLTYPDSLNVTLTSSLLVANPQAAFVVHGSKGSFIKNRTDVQETQLLESIKPKAKGFGVEQPSQAGTLSLVDAKGNITNTKIESQPGSYFGIFEAVYQSIVNNSPYPITNEDILTQLDILTSPEG